MDRMKRGILCSESILNPVHPVRPLWLRLTLLRLSGYGSHEIVLKNLNSGQVDSGSIGEYPCCCSFVFRRG